MFSIKNLFKKKAKESHIPEKRIDFFKKRFKKDQQKRAIAQERRQKIRNYIERAGIGVSPQKLSRTFFNAAVFINLAISAYLIYHFSANYGITWSTIAASMIALWVLIFVLLIFIFWIMFYIVVDFFNLS